MKAILLALCFLGVLMVGFSIGYVEGIDRQQPECNLSVIDYKLDTIQGEINQVLYNYDALTVCRIHKAELIGILRHVHMYSDDFLEVYE